MMSKINKKMKSSKRFCDFLIPEYVTVCSDVLITPDQCVSLIRITDSIAVFSFPIEPTRFVVVAQFALNFLCKKEEFVSSKPEYKLVLFSPSGVPLELGAFIPNLDDSLPWTTTRGILDLSSQLSLLEQGVYTLKVFGRVADMDYEELMSKNILLYLSEGVPGLYLAEFSAPHFSGATINLGQGWVALLPSGQVRGSDGGYHYEGRYLVQENVISAELQVRRHDVSIESIFGDVENFQLKLRGEVSGPTIYLEGSKDENSAERIHVALKRQLTMPSTQ